MTPQIATSAGAPSLGEAIAAGEDCGDPVLESLAEAEERYRQARANWARQVAGLKQSHEAAVAQASDDREELVAEVRRLTEEAARERERANRQQALARRLADGLKDVHRSLFDGNVYSLILKACLTITGATRGLYLTAWEGSGLRIRAAIDLDGYPKAPASPRILALCRRVLEENETFVCNDPSCFDDLPPPERPDEDFRNCLVAPAVLMKTFSGIVLLADKVEGEFDESDVAMVLSVGDQAAVAVENKRLQDELLQSYFNVVGVLADAVEAKDPYTHGHCEMVARYGRQTAERLGLTDGQRSVVCFGGLLHDVGKIGVSDGVLNKSGKLMPEEWDLMRSHVRIGRDLLARIPALEQVADVVLHHHERFDGKGYPEGLSGENISLASRIVCVADAYAAMVSKRSYKESMTDAEAREELVRCKGTHFDPAVVDAFLAVLDAPPEKDDCPDGCGALPLFYHPMELRHALQAQPLRTKTLTV